MAEEVPTVRWGIITTGFIASWFVEDLVLERKDAKAKHIIQAIGASAVKKGEDFAQKYIPKGSQLPTIYGSYEEVYADPNVDVVYIGTPHAFHKKNCLDAIAAGKNVLCEKAFTINAKEAKEVFDAAKAKGVYIAEAMWLRHRPLVRELRKLLYEEKVIGEVFRTTSYFGLLLDIPNLPNASRYRDLALGAGSLLDIGIYSLTWAILTLDRENPSKPDTPKISAIQSFEGQVEVTTSVLLHYLSTGRQGIISSTTNANGDTEVQCRIEGSDGYIEVEGPAPSLPLSFTVYPKIVGDPNSGDVGKSKGKQHKFDSTARGFVYEADNTALDIAAGRKQSEIMPWSETIRVMEMMDEIRNQGGTRYPQDDE